MEHYEKVYSFSKMGRIKMAIEAKKLKILVVSQNYYPEQFRVTDICESLASMGHQVTVLTGKPCYGFPNGQIPSEYKKGKNSQVINGVKVLRINQYPRKTGFVNRFINYYSFASKSAKAVKKLDKDFDVVLVNQLSPVFQIKAGAKYKKKNGAKLVVYCLDLWPESLLAGGIPKGSLPYKYYHKVSKKLYKNADEILVTSKCFIDYFKQEFGLTNVEYLPQYAEDIFNSNDNNQKEKDQSQVNLTFAGNVGHAQSVDTIIKAVNELKDRKELKVHIVGDGEALNSAIELSKELGVEEKIIFHGRKPLSDMPTYYQMADAMLVTLTKDTFASMTMPGKVQTYMATGKPIIASANGETKTQIEQSKAGFTCDAEDYMGLKDAIITFLDCDQDKKKDLSKNALRYYEQNFTKDKFFTKLLQKLK